MFCDESYEPLRARFSSEPLMRRTILLTMRGICCIAPRSPISQSSVERPLPTSRSFRWSSPLCKGKRSWLARCLTALAAQTYNVFEAIVVDRYYGDAEFAALGLEQGEPVRSHA